MSITPQRMIKEGWVRGIVSEIESEQIQQIGLDLRVGKIQRVTGTATLMKNSKELPRYSDLDTNQDDCWYLQANQGYAFESMEECSIPIGYKGFVIHRSTMNRSVCLVTGSVYDPGYKGIIAGTIYVHQVPILIQRGARIAQFLMSEGEKGSAYDGDYQNQKSHISAAEKLNEQNRR